MTEFFVRTAGKRDVEAVSHLLAETWHATYDGIYGEARVAEITASWHSPAALAPRVSRPQSEFVVADDGERLGGMAYAASSDADRKLVILHQLYVRPDCQGRGIGQVLLREIEDAFPDAERLRVEVEAANEPAVGFWRANGFEPAGRTQSCGSADSGIPADIYEKRLA